MTILSVNLLKSRFTVEWAQFHAHDSPTGQSHQRFRGHTRDGDTTSPDHPRCACPRHRHRGDGPSAPTIHAGHSLGHSPRDSRLHGQIHPLPRFPGHHHRRSQRGRYRPLLRQSPRYRSRQRRSPRHGRSRHMDLHDAERGQPGIPGDRNRRRRYARRNRAGRLLQLDTLPTHGGSTPPRGRPSPKTT